MKKTIVALTIALGMTTISSHAAITPKLSGPTVYSTATLVEDLDIWAIKKMDTSIARNSSDGTHVFAFAAGSNIEIKNWGLAIGGSGSAGQNYNHFVDQGQIVLCANAEDASTSPTTCLKVQALNNGSYTYQKDISNNDWLYYTANAPINMQSKENLNFITVGTTDNVAAGKYVLAAKAFTFTD